MQKSERNIYSLQSCENCVHVGICVFQTAFGEQIRKMLASMHSKNSFKMYDKSYEVMALHCPQYKESEAKDE